MATNKITLGPLPHFKEEWAAGTTYKREAIVTHKGSTYMCTTAGTQTEPSYTYNPETGKYITSAGWKLLAVGSGADVVEDIAETKARVTALESVVADIETIAEGYVRVAGSSSPALSYKSYKYHEQGGFGRESAFSLFYPCLVGTKLTGGDEQVGKILHILQKLDYGHDIYGVPRKIDGTEGDVMIVNVEPYYRIMGKHTIQGTDYDVFLMSRTPFEWQGIEAEHVARFGWAPDFCVSHVDEDGVTRMHSVFNPDWNGSYWAPQGMTGKYVYTTDEETGEMVETFDGDATVMGGAGGLHTTNKALYVGEQEAMNQNPDTTKTVPYMNATAAGVENMFTAMLAEGGTFDRTQRRPYGQRLLRQ